MLPHPLSNFKIQKYYQNEEIQKYYLNLVAFIQEIIYLK